MVANVRKRAAIVLVSEGMSTRHERLLRTYIGAGEASPPLYRGIPGNFSRPTPSGDEGEEGVFGSQPTFW